MAKKPGAPVRGSTTGRPLLVLFDVLGQRWSLRILWELRAERLTFRELQSRCDDISPTILNRRLKQLRDLQLLDHDSQGYGFTAWGRKIGKQLAQLESLASQWAKDIG
jgi:DNA-binding HxlR family transcriptional regulator